MRELGSCVSEYAVQVSETSCSSKYNNSSKFNPCIISPAPAPAFTPSIQNCVTCLYRSILPNNHHIITTLTWTNTNTNTASASESRALTLLFHDHRDPSTSAAFKITSSRLFRKSKGTKSLHLRSSKIQLHWDLSTARYTYPPGPEPIDAFYVVVLVDSHPALILGDVKDHREFKINAADAQFALLSRQEHFSGNNLYSTKAQFCEAGGAHDISIRCSNSGESEGGPVLSVCIDKKVVIRVKKLQWNFRGNQTIFVDGLLVDLMWDVHDWFYNQDSGYAVFMFRTRTGLDSISNSRLWMEEKKKLLLHNDHFSFIIYAYNNL